MTLRGPQQRHHTKSVKPSWNTTLQLIRLRLQLAAMWARWWFNCGLQCPREPADSTDVRTCTVSNAATQTSASAEQGASPLRRSASLPFLVCQRSPCDAHHIKFAQPRALGRKVSDEFTVPLCRDHHTELHRQGNEASWWANHQIDPIEISRELWAKT